MESDFDKLSPRSAYIYGVQIVPSGQRLCVH